MVYRRGDNFVGEITPAGTFTEYSTPFSGFGITAEPDGNIWFTAYHGDAVGKVTPSGIVTTYSNLDQGDYRGLISGPGGDLWVSEVSHNKILEFNTQGQKVATFSVSHESYGLTVGPDGNVWFGENDGNNIGRLTPQGTVTEFAIPTANTLSAVVSTGPDGNIYFAEYNTNKIGRLTIALGAANAGNGVYIVDSAKRQHDRRHNSLATTS